jgi:lipopolysaccharide export system protein LptC
MKAPAVMGAFMAQLKDTLSWASTYLPIFLMGLLAMGTWWLVKNTPVFDAPREAAPPSHTPDYTMENVIVRKFSPQGSLRTQIQGDQLRHYPDTDTLEIDHIRMRAVGTTGEITTAQGLLGWSNRDGSELRLRGQAVVVREATATEPTMTFSGESLTAQIPQRQVIADQPMTIEREGLRVRADAMTYDNNSGIAQARGRVQATYSGTKPPPKK